MNVKELQLALKSYQIEKDKANRMTKAIETLVKGDTERTFHIDLSEVVPAKPKPQEPLMIHGYGVYAPMNDKTKKSTDLSKMLGMTLSDMDALDVLILLLNKQNEKVEKMESALRKEGVEI